MPSERQFQNAFKLNRGLVFGNYTLIDVLISENQIQHGEYSYPIKLTFKNNTNGNISILKRDIGNYLSGHLKVKTRWGNLYNCFVYNSPSEIKSEINGDKIILYLQGHSNKL